MKRTYVRPTMVGERFVANEYVAACGVGGTEYEFECNAPEGTLYYYPRSDGKIDGEYTGSKWSFPIPVGTYKPCGAKHKVNAKDDFYDGFVDYNGNIKPDWKEEGVIVWRERRTLGVSGHATKKLNMNEWERAKS